MKNLKKAAAVTIAAGGMLAAGAGVASAHGGAVANGSATQSPGVVSGNLAEIPVHIPANVTGNTATVIGGLNPTFGNHTHNV